MNQLILYVKNSKYRLGIYWNFSCFI